MRFFPAQVGPGGEPVSDSASFTSSNANDVIQEEQNAITSSGQALIPLANPANNTQLSQAMARYASGGLFGVDSGAINAYVISATGSFTPPEAYFDGMAIRWYAINAGTGASTINAFGIGVVDLVQEDGTALPTGFIDTIVLNEATYDSGAGKFFANQAAGIISATPIFSQSFTSAEQTITTSGSLTLAHGLGVVPKLITYHLICKTAENGYSIGDLAFPTFKDMANSSQGIGLVPDATNLNIRMASSGTVFGLTNKSTGVNTTLTNANWKLIVESFA